MSDNTKITIPNPNSKQTESDYYDIYNKSITPGEMEKFWLEESKEISWIKEPTLPNIFKLLNPPFQKWFTDGTINICYNLLDRHIKSGNADDTALISYCAYTKTTISFTYIELLRKVNIMSKILLDIKVKKGDIVIIYMPMIPEIIIAMLACIRIGAVHSVVFGGFASAELADRIKSSNAKAIICASVGIEPRKKVNYFPLAVKGIEISKLQDIPIILIQRKDVLEVTKEEISKFNGKTIIYNDLKDKYENIKINKEKIEDDQLYIKPVELNANDPLYILYTSGTIGTPKGIIRDCGSIVSVNYTMKYIMNLHAKDVAFSSSDIGWVVGHLFIVYGPLLRGATTIIFEGKPVGTPDSSVCWDIIEKYKVKTFYSAPTAIRVVKKEDPEYKIMHKYNLSSLESICLSGERCDPETFQWLQKGVGESILINDHWWQTETGYPICCNNKGIYRFKSKPGSASRPLPGFKVVILDKYNQEVKIGTIGNICIESPFPPGFMISLLGDDDYYVKKYFCDDRKYYMTGDCGYFDSDGDIFIMSRNDDMLKTAGHRLSAGRIEEVLMGIKEVCEAAVVPIPDEIKKELPFAFVIIKDDIKDPEKIKAIPAEAQKMVVANIGAISRLKNTVICQRLPKTKSGKIVRKLLREILITQKDKDIKIEETIENGKEIIEEIRSVLIKEKII